MKSSNSFIKAKRRERKCGKKKFSGKCSIWLRAMQNLNEQTNVFRSLPFDAFEMNSTTDFHKFNFIAQKTTQNQN